MRRLTWTHSYPNAVTSSSLVVHLSIARGWLPSFLRSIVLMEPLAALLLYIQPRTAGDNSCDERYMHVSGRMREASY